jgi:hypothetical protein
MINYNESGGKAERPQEKGKQSARETEESHPCNGVMKAKINKKFANGRKT